MKKLLTIALFAAALGAPRAAAADVKVVATVPDLAALAREVGGKHISVLSLSLPTQDPHFVDARPHLVLELSKADLLVAVGLDLEVGWLPALQRGARNPTIAAGGRGFLDCSRYARKLEIPRGKIDRSMGDIHPGGNPHYLYSPLEAYNCARAIATRLGEIDPPRAATYRANLRQFGKRLTARVRVWKKVMAPHHGKAVISYHRSWIYLLDWLGLENVATFEPKPGIPPSASHVAKVMRRAKERGVKVILQESYYPDRTGKLVARRVGAQLVQISGGADVSKGESYIAHMDHLIDTLAGALSGGGK
jgi:zinc/manganese transport system substrate-binding protein